MPAESTQSDPDPHEDLMAELLGRPNIDIPGYKLLSEISRGGQAIVFKAQQESTNNTVAVKLLRGGQLADDAARERLKREARVLAALRDDNIVTVIDFGQTADGHDFLVMNYIVGRRLDEFFPDSQHADRPPLDPSFLLRLFLKICVAVSEAHRCGITHRDLSPSNILVDDAGEPFILDFGLARTAFDQFFNPEKQGPSITGQFIGKLAYASPEQAKGKHDLVDIRTDVYALGVILYQILTGGQFPYVVVGSMAEVLNNIINAEPTPPSKLIESREAVRAQKQRRLRERHPPLVNTAIEAIVLKSLEKEPVNRYQSAGELAQDVRAYLQGGPTNARVLAKQRLLGSKAITRPLLTIAVGALLLVIAWIASAWLSQSLQLKIADPANAEATQIARAIVAQAESADTPSRQSELARDARKTILPLIRELDQTNVEVWNLAGRIAVLCQDNRIAVLTTEALKRLQPDAVNSPLLQKLEALADKDNLAAWTEGRPECLKMYKRAKSGNSAAMGQIGWWYQQGRFGLPQDDTEALNWYRKGADAGDRLSLSQIGSMYEQGEAGLPRDEAEAVKWYQKGATAGDGLAMTFLASMYESGRGGLQKDDAEALKWYRRGGEAGDSHAMACLATLYDEGRCGLPTDEAEAVNWYRKASNAGYIPAMYFLGEAYRSGRGGLAKDEGEAVAWFTKGAFAGDKAAMRALARMYELGRGGLTENRSEAVQWYRRAARLGNKPAQTWMRDHGLTW